MKGIVTTKYNNLLELAEELGKIPVASIDDLDEITEELESLGYTCKLSSNTNYLEVYPNW